MKAVKEIDRKPQDLSTRHESRVAKAKSDIEAEVTKFKASVEELGARFNGRKK